MCQWVSLTARHCCRYVDSQVDRSTCLLIHAVSVRVPVSTTTQYIICTYGEPLSICSWS